jgi:hypothetical protein
MNASLKFIVIAAMHVAGITAVQAQTPAGPNRPADVPSGYVITPFGYFHPSCVGHLAEGDVLRPDRHVIQHSNGTTTQMTRCDHPHYRADGEAVSGDEQGVEDPNISHSWIVAASCVAGLKSPCGATTTSSFGFLSAQWSVPPTPPSNDGQTLYYFPGLEDIHDVVTIIQPVLGWNSDYASAWGIASWNCCVSGTTYEAPPQPVSPGDTILGYMFDTCPAGTPSCSSWDVVTFDLQNGKFSELLSTSSFTQTFNWAFGGVLEVYNIKQCSDYPNNPNGFSGGGHSISFNAIALYNYNFQQIANPNWTVTNFLAAGSTPQCSYGATVPTQVILND